jgi:Ca-activated chloride channel family protein
VIVAYEVVMKDSSFEIGGKALKYQEQATGQENGEWFTIAVRYKDPGTTVSKGLDFQFGESIYTKKPDKDWVFASGVIEFGMIASKSDYAGTASLQDAIKRVSDGAKSDKYREEFVELMKTYAELYD